MRIEVRDHYFLEDKIIVSTSRTKRPKDFVKEKTKLPKNKYSKTCPFCFGNEKMTPPENYITKIGKKWEFRCFPNKYPLFSPDIEFKCVRKKLFDTREGYGYHDILVETPDHNKQWQNFSKEKMVRLIETYKEKYADLLNKDGIEYVMIFKNYGEEGGASLVHSHSQIIGTPFLPGRVVRDIEGLKLYKKKHKSCAYCDIVAKEKGGKREIFKNKDFLVISPYCARYPFETWIISRRHIKDFMDINAEYLGGTIYKLVKRLFKTLGDFPFNMFLHYLPEENNYDYHFHVALQPRLKKEASVELGYGTFVNTIFPEKVAEMMKK